MRANSDAAGSLPRLVRLRELVRSLLERIGLVSPPPGENAYHAFISYSHAVDGALAPAVQRGLQRFAKPWYRPRAVRIFRDEASLSANPGLWSSIAEALDRSSFFILLASPGAADSPWVAREAAQWRATKPVAHLLIGLTEGELAWDPAAQDFDWDRTTALPESLRGAFAEEPRFIDLRWAHSGEQLSLSDARFRDAVAELAAPLHGVPKDVLAGEEVRQHRRTVRIARGAAALLALLTLASALFGLFAVLQRNEARRQRDLATSRSLVQTASANLDSRIDLAALLSLEAYRLHASAESRSSLIQALQRSEHIVGLLHVEQPIERIAVDVAGEKLAASGTESVVIWSLGPDRRRIAVLPKPNAKALAFRADGEVLAVGGATGISLWRLEPEPTLSRRITFGGAKALAFSRDGKRLGAVGPASIAVFDAETGERLRREALGMSVSTAEFAPGGTRVAVGGLRTLTIFDVIGRRPPLAMPSTETPVAVAFDSRGRHVAAVDLQGDGVTVWDSATGDLVTRVALQDAVHTVGFAPDGRLMLGTADGRVQLGPMSGSASSQVLQGPREKVFDVDFPSGGPLVSAGEQGIIVLWDPSRSALRRTISRSSDPISDLDFAERASSLVVGGLGDELTVWSLEDGRVLRRTLRTGPVTAVAIDGAGARVAVAGRGVTLYEIRGARRRLQPAAGVAPGALEFSGTGVVAWAAAGRVVLWDAVNARRLGPVPTVGTTLALGFSADGNRLAIAGTDGLTLWDLEDRRKTELIRGQTVTAVAVSRSGQAVVSATPDDIVVTDVRGGTTRFAFSIPQGVSVKLAFSPDEQTLAVGMSTGQLELIDARSGRMLGLPLTVPGGPVSGVDFGADGATLATGAQGGGVTVWNDSLWSDVAAVELRLCDVAGRSLTRDEWRAYLPGQPYRKTCG
jgi:WD40 repeat protein